MSIKQCETQEIEPDLLRFETIKLLKELTLQYALDFDKARTLLLDKTREFEDRNLNDEMSLGIMKNLKE